MIDSLDKKNFFDVDILLSVYNGAEFLPSFLDSLASQSAVKINLLVRDDGSSDDSIAIIEGFRSSFDSLTILRGINIGASESFRQLMQVSRAEIVALADQDDIWLPDHLATHIRAMSKAGGEPTLTFGMVREFFGKHKKRTFPSSNRIDYCLGIFFENPGRGCTFVMNREMKDLSLKEWDTFSIPWHDWKILLLARFLGKLKFVDEVSVLYRLHSKNAIGSTWGSFFPGTIRELVKVHLRARKLMEESLRLGLDFNQKCYSDIAEFLKFTDSSEKSASGARPLLFTLALLIKSKLRMKRIQDLILKVVYVFYFVIVAFIRRITQ